MKFFKSLLISLQFLTILPLPKIKEYDGKDLGKAAAYFPLAGFLIGIVLFFSVKFLSVYFSPVFVSVLCLGLWHFLSGGLHLEGFTDTADGFACGQNREKILLVMKDTHCGAKGVAATIIFLFIKWAMIYELCLHKQFLSLIAAPLLSRWAMSFVCAISRYAGKQEGLGFHCLNNCSIFQVGISGFFCLGLGWVMLKNNFLIIGLVVFLSTICLVKFLNRKLGGVTGDVLGAINEVFEVGVMFVSLLIL
jgi:cobalamin 5'-phosphate synthase/cobalamin synthase